MTRFRRRYQYLNLRLVGSNNLHLKLKGVLRVSILRGDPQYPTRKLRVLDRITALEFLRVREFSNIVCSDPAMARGPGQACLGGLPD